MSQALANRLLIRQPYHLSTRSINRPIDIPKRTRFRPRARRAPSPHTTSRLSTIRQIALVIVSRGVQAGIHEPGERGGFLEMGEYKTCHWVKKAGAGWDVGRTKRTYVVLIVPLRFISAYVPSALGIDVPRTSLTHPHASYSTP